MSIIDHYALTCAIDAGEMHGKVYLDLANDALLNYILQRTQHAPHSCAQAVTEH